MWRRFSLARSVVGTTAARNLRNFHQVGAAVSSPIQPVGTVPSFEIYDIRDNADEGKLVRVQYFDRLVSITVYPQLGPRKTDPLDPTPQFDQARRSAARFRLSDIATFLAVMECRMPTATLAGRTSNLTFSKAADGRSFELMGTITRSAGDHVPWNISFTKSHAVMFFRFMDSSLNEGFGFRAHHDVMKAKEKRDREATARK